MWQTLGVMENVWLFISGANLEGKMSYIILNYRIHKKNTIYVMLSMLVIHIPMTLSLSINLTELCLVVLTPELLICVCVDIMLYLTLLTLVRNCQRSLMRDGKRKPTVCKYSHISHVQMVRHFVATLDGQR